MPEENEELIESLNSIEAMGGGNRPESGLEALALAIKSDWTRAATLKRHIIVLFTNAPAHPFEMAKEKDISGYPKNMPESYDELESKWNAVNYPINSQEHTSRIDNRAKRFLLFAPDEYPWFDISFDFENSLIFMKKWMT